jgi:hypothetical protein
MAAHGRNVILRRDAALQPAIPRVFGAYTIYQCFPVVCTGLLTTRQRSPVANLLRAEVFHTADCGDLCTNPQDLSRLTIRRWGKFVGRLCTELVHNGGERRL